MEKMDFKVLASGMFNVWVNHLKLELFAYPVNLPIVEIAIRGRESLKEKFGSLLTDYLISNDISLEKVSRQEAKAIILNRLESLGQQVICQHFPTNNYLLLRSDRDNNPPASEGEIEKMQIAINRIGEKLDLE